jgi:hypothetical protein
MAAGRPADMWYLPPVRVAAGPDAVECGGMFAGQDRRPASDGGACRLCWWRQVDTHKLYEMSAASSRPSARSAASTPWPKIRLVR